MRASLVQAPTRQRNYFVDERRRGAGLPMAILPFALIKGYARVALRCVRLVVRALNPFHYELKAASIGSFNV